MALPNATADLDDDWDLEVSTEIPVMVGGVTSSPESGEVPRMYDDIEDEPGTATNESVIAFAKLSNPKALPRVVRPPRPGEPIERRAAHLLGFIDGRTPLGVIFASAGIDEGEAVIVLAQLVDLGIITIR